MQNQGFDGFDTDDTWTRGCPTTESGIRKYEAFHREFQAQKDQQTKTQQQKEQEIQTVAKY